MMTTQEPDVPALRFPEFWGEWKEKKLGISFPKIRNGFVGTATPYYVRDGIPYLQGKNIKSGKIKINGLVSISEKFHAWQKKSQLRRGDILMVQSGHVGECASVTTEYDGSNCHALIVLSPIVGTVSQFFVAYFYSPIGRRKIHKITTGNTISHILTSDLKPLRTYITETQEQQKIASFLSSVDTKINQLSKKKALLEKYKKGMMQKLFSQALRFKDEQGNDFPDWEEKTLGEVATFSKGTGISKNDVANDGKTFCIRYGQLYTQYSETIVNVVSKTHVPVEQLVLSKKNDVIIPASGETALDIATASCVTLDGIALGGDL